MKLLYSTAFPIISAGMQNSDFRVYSMFFKPNITEFKAHNGYDLATVIFWDFH